MIDGPQSIFATREPTKALKLSKGPAYAFSAIGA